MTNITHYAIQQRAGDPIGETDIARMAMRIGGGYWNDVSLYTEMDMLNGVWSRTNALGMQAIVAVGTAT